jgi:hypothetical protein
MNKKQKLIVIFSTLIDVLTIIEFGILDFILQKINLFFVLAITPMIVHLYTIKIGLFSFSPMTIEKFWLFFVVVCWTLIWFVVWVHYYINSIIRRNDKQ